MNNFFILLIALFILGKNGGEIAAQEPSRLVLLETSYGNIQIKLYNETPLHRDNFLKLVEKHFYDSLLFHRVINRFMIQGGDPDSKNAPPGKMLGEGEVGYTIPAEFNPALFHKRGVLAAARNGDEENPERASSGCQFYIVQGKIFTDSLMEVVAKRVTRMQAYNKVVRRNANKPLFDTLALYQKQENIDSIKITKAKIDKLTEEELLNTVPYKFTEEQKKIYTTVGGTPHLDGSYTVFGEVMEGMEVVDKIASAPRDKADRPLADIRMKISILK
jgi:peptidylprolyl isomerase